MGWHCDCLYVISLSRNLLLNFNCGNRSIRISKSLCWRLKIIWILLRSLLCKLLVNLLKHFVHIWHPLHHLLKMLLSKNISRILKLILDFLIYYNWMDLNDLMRVISVFINFNVIFIYHVTLHHEFLPKIII